MLFYVILDSERSAGSIVQEDTSFYPSTCASSLTDAMSIYLNHIFEFSVLSFWFLCEIVFRNEFFVTLVNSVLFYFVGGQHL